MIKKFYPAGTMICCPECGEVLLKTVKSLRVFDVLDAFNVEEIQPESIYLDAWEYIHCCNCQTKINIRLDPKVMDLVVPREVPSYDIHNFNECPIYKHGKDQEGSLFRCRHEWATTNAVVKHWEGVYCWGVFYGCKAAMVKYKNEGGDVNG